MPCPSHLPTFFVNALRSFTYRFLQGFPTFWNENQRQKDSAVFSFYYYSMFKYLLMVPTAADRYDRIETFNTDSLYNRPAPEPWVSFAMGGIFSILSLGLYVQRVRRMPPNVTGKGAQLSPAIFCRELISAFVDRNDTLFILCKTVGQFFLFLGGLQCNFQLTFIIMLALLAGESCLDALRIFIALGEVKTSIQKDLVVVESWKGQLEEKNKKKKKKKKSENDTQLTPTSVYEDLSRPPLIVIMVFITQSLLITFVVRFLAR